MIVVAEGKLFDRLLVLENARMTTPPPITLGGVRDIDTVEKGEYKFTSLLAYGKTKKNRGVV